MTSNVAPDRHHFSAPGHISSVQATLGDPTMCATELGDLLCAGLGRRS